MKQWQSIPALALMCFAGCGPDIGDCDPNALGGSEVPGMEAPHKGQALVDATCASGTCHTASAKGDSRVGAPAGLNFDVVVDGPTPEDQNRALRAGSTVREWAEDMWSLIDGGSMPPEGQRAALSKADKEAMRNWLACGAPTILAQSTAPIPAEWESIYTELAGKTCLGCHGMPPDPEGAGDGFQLGKSSSDACGAYRNVRQKAVTTDEGCAATGMSLIVPNQPDESLLYRKLFGDPPCGAFMPKGGEQPLADDDIELVKILRMWIEAGAPAPEGCTL